MTRTTPTRTRSGGLTTPHVGRVVWLVLATALMALPTPSTTAAEPCSNVGLAGTPYAGFGADTAGGAGKPVHRVTSLSDAGPGSLREALSRGHRCVVFDVGGEVRLARQLYVKGAFVTVDGFTAPAPGITLRDYGIAMWGDHGAHDVIVRGLRFRDSGRWTCGAGRACYDGLQVKQGAYRVVIDHVSSDRAGDGAIDIAGRPGPNVTRDVTVQWSILSGTRNQSLIDGAIRISMHHNLFVDGQNRNPQADWDARRSTTPPDTVLDFRNNLVWNFLAYGTIVHRMATANVVNNYYYASLPVVAGRALIVRRDGRAHVAGNYSGNGADIDAHTTETVPFVAASVPTTDACTAAHEVMTRAGARSQRFGPDSVDQAYLDRLSLTPVDDCSVKREGLPAHSHRRR